MARGVLALPQKDKERNKLGADVVQRIFLGVGVRHVAEVVVSLLVVDFVIAGVLEGRCVDGLTDGGAVSMEYRLGGGFLLRGGNGGDLGGCCGEGTTATGGGEDQGILELMDDTTIRQDCHM